MGQSLVGPVPGILWQRGCGCNHCGINVLLPSTSSHRDSSVRRCLILFLYKSKLKLQDGLYHTDVNRL